MKKIKRKEMNRVQLREFYQMQLAAISTVSMQNTHQTVKGRVLKDTPYWTVAYGDVCRRVDSEIYFRERCEQLEKLLSEKCNIKLEDVATAIDLLSV